MRPSWKTGLLTATLVTTLMVAGQFASSANAQATATPTETPTDTISEFPTETLTPTLSSADLTSAVRQATGTSRPGNLKGPAATALALAQAGKLVSGPKSGTLVDDKVDVVSEYRSGALVHNFMAEARFYNAPTKLGYYGFVLRDFGGSGFYIWIIDYYKNWSFGLDSRALSSGFFRLGDMAKDGFNDMRLMVKNEYGYLFINGEYITRMNIGKKRLIGTVSVIAGTYRGRKASNQTTPFDNFRVWDLGE
jgi:hypothetical protein